MSKILYVEAVTGEHWLQCILEIVNSCVVFWIKNPEKGLSR